MDPISAAIVAALAAGVVSGVTKVGDQVVSDAYNKLKELLKKKFGARSKVVKAMKDLEADPKSAARKEVVKEEVTAVGAERDRELLAAARQLLKAIKAKPGGEQIVQMAMGAENIQIAGNGNVVNVGTSKNRK